MHTGQAFESPPGSPITCIEAAGEFELMLPARPRRLARGLALLVLSVCGAVAFVGLVTASIGAVALLGGLGVMILAIAYATMADGLLKSVRVGVTPARVTLAERRARSEETREFARNHRHRARQWYLPQRPGSRATPRGIEIGPVPYDRAAGSPLRDKSLPRFGAWLSRGEMDWVVWRMNRSMDASPSRAPSIQVPMDAGAIPADATSEHGILIEDDGSTCRIRFPNSTEQRTYAGTFSVFFGIALMLVSNWLPERFAPGLRNSADQPLLMFMSALGCLLGAAAIVKGLTQLFGKKELIVTPRFILYRAALSGIPLWMRLPTDAVLSLGVPEGDAARPLLDNCSIAPVESAVIRTARHELRYSGAIPKGAGPWVRRRVATAVARARSTAGAHPLELRFPASGPEGPGIS